MLDSGQQTVMDEYAKKLYLPEEHLIVNLPWPGDCVHDEQSEWPWWGVDNLFYRVHGRKTKKNGITGDILQVDIKRSTYKDKWKVYS